MVQYLSRVRTCFQPGQNTVEYSSSLHTVSYSAQLKLNDQLVIVSKIKPDMLYDLSTIYYCTAINFCTRLHYATFDGLESRMSVVANTVSDLRSGYASGHAHMPSTHNESHGMHVCTKRTLQSARQLRTFRYICKWGSKVTSERLNLLRVLLFYFKYCSCWHVYHAVTQ